MRISHLRVPSARTCSSTISGRASVWLAASFSRSGRAMLRISAKSLDALMVDPVPELRDAHAPLALGHAEFGERKRQFGARGAGEA